MFTKTYDIIYSIGYDCTCARYLAKYSLRSFAGPFDWITLCDYPTRMSYILNGFENFLNKDDLEFLPRPPEKDYLNPYTIDFYNKRDNFHFFHDFPKGKSLDESFPFIKEKYNRRIKRFDEMLRNKKNVLLMCVSNTEIVDNDVIRKYSEAIMQKYNKKIDFLFVENDVSKAPGEIETIEISPHIMKCKVRTVDPEFKGKIPLTSKACEVIFTGLKSVGQKKRRYRKYWRNLLVKVLSLFIFYRPWRKAFKLKYRKI